jgi:putative peptidoglycan lipid II flippase
MFVLALNFCLNLALMRPLQHVGPPVATSVAAWLNVSLLTVMLIRRDYMRPDGVLGSRVARMAGATGIMAVALLGTRMALIPVSGRHVSVLVLGVLVAVGLVTYCVLAQVLEVFDTASAVRKVARRFRRAAHA